MPEPTLSGAGPLASAPLTPRPEPKGLRRRVWPPERNLLQDTPPPPDCCPRRTLPERSCSADVPTVLVVAQGAAVRNAVAGELSQHFELLNATFFTSAVRKLSARPSLAAVIVDLDLDDGPGAPWLLARLVDHAFEGPRLLLSSALGPAHASCLSRGSVSHFTLARPWPPGELLASLASALGYAAPSARLQDS